MTSDCPLLSNGGYLPRVTVHDGRAIEEALAGGDLWQPQMEVDGAVVEASFAALDPPLMKRLREGGVPYIIDPQSLRFTTSAYQEIGRIRSLPYAPQSPFADPSQIDEPTLRQFVEGVVGFQLAHGAASLLAPGVPIRDEKTEAWLTFNERLLRTTIALNGTAGRPRLPVLAYLAPGRRALIEPEALFAPLVDLPIAGAYVQPLRINAVRDSVEKLVLYLRMFELLSASGLPALAGRVGAFGLVLHALGVNSFDSGLGEAEQFDLASLNRVPPKQDKKESGARGDQRIYLEPLKTTLRGRDARALLNEPGLRSRFVCTLACCRFRGFEQLPTRRRPHYLFVRQKEVAELQQLPTRAMRINHVYEKFLEARDLASVVRRTLDWETPRFDHLDRWIAVLARLTEAPVRVA